MHGLEFRQKQHYPAFLLGNETVTVPCLKLPTINLHKISIRA